jgi:2-oxoglutarate ferredoxin oxidoreductase subunit alpha
VLEGFERILVPELNGGQLVRLLRAEFLIAAESMPKLQGQPFRVQEIRARIDAMLSEGGT